MQHVRAGPPKGVPRNASTAWSRAEAEVDRVCAHYGLSCLSVYRALAPAVRERRRGFAMRDVARDCVHPSHGTHGTAHLTDLMVHWLESAPRQEMRPYAGGAAAAAAGASATRDLPTALHRAAAREARTTHACYFFDAQGWRQRPSGDTTWMVAPWQSARCAPDEDAPPPTTPRSGSCEPLPHTECPRSRWSYARLMREWGAPGVATTEAGGWRGPRGWLWCDRTISPTPRMYKCLSAFAAGATVFLTVAAPSFLTLHALGGRPSADALATVKLLHLISHEHMGIAHVSCVHGCSCEARELDAHRRSGRNVSVYVEASVVVRFHPSAPSAAESGRAPPRRHCAMALRVLGRTSSGEHRFVLTRLTVSSRAAGSGAAA